MVSEMAGDLATPVNGGLMPEDVIHRLQAVQLKNRGDENELHMLLPAK